MFLSDHEAVMVGFGSVVDGIRGLLHFNFQVITKIIKVSEVQNKVGSCNFHCINLKVNVFYVSGRLDLI